jgi:hypothetical protein
MAKATFRGTISPLQQWYERNFDPSSGYTYRTEFRGFDFFRMQALSDQYTRLGMSAVLRTEAGMSMLTVTDATANVLIDKWELGVDEERPSIFENLIFKNLIKNATDPSTVVMMLRTALQNGDPSSSGWNYLTQNPLIGVDANNNPTSTPNGNAANFLNALGGTFTGTPAWMTQLKQYFDDYNLGVTNFIRGKYRLRHTTNAPARWNPQAGFSIGVNPFNPYWNIADFNVEEIYTISQLLAEVQNFNYWVLPLPGYLAYKILNYVVPDLSATPQYIWGAVKSMSNAVTAANNRVDIETQYLIDAVSTNLYKQI